MEERPPSNALHIDVGSTNRTIVPDTLHERFGSEARPMDLESIIPSYPNPDDDVDNEVGGSKVDSPTLNSKDSSQKTSNRSRGQILNSLQKGDPV